MIFRLLDDEIIFPEPALAEEDGLLAVGGDLSTERLLLAYRSGIFPWFSADDPILWYSPHNRCVIFPDRIKVSKSMRKMLQANPFQITVNHAFQEVITKCAHTPRAGQDGTWITPEMQVAYIELHQKGFAHSIEVWQNNQLVGGLYGVRINDVFCGESMFSHATNASKAALIFLAKEMNFKLIDCQLPTRHIFSLGAEMISRELYMSYLEDEI